MEKTNDTKNGNIPFKIITDYFNFDQNDIDLHKMKKCFDTYAKDMKMSEKDFAMLNENFKDFLFFFEKNDLHKSSFPYLKNSVMGYLNAAFEKYNYCDNAYYKYYFFMVLLANINNFKVSIKNYYLGIVKNNYFGISPKFGYVITRDVMISNEYEKFTNHLAEWYTKIELIIFYSSILNNFGVMLNFDESKYSLENNFDFSLQSFAKKNFLKLASYIFKKTTLELDFKVGEVNYNKIFFLLASSFTCGISFTDIFLGGDIRHLGLLAVNFFYQI
jgi:hypothetical protein